MAIYLYPLARGGQSRWMFIIDLPPTADGRRRQMKRRGFTSQTAALAAEAVARSAYSGAEPSADGSLAAELEEWLVERDIDRPFPEVTSSRGSWWPGEAFRSH